jgi:hypothetical protein
MRVSPLSKYEVRYLGKQVRYLLTRRHLIFLRKHPARWQSNWPATTPQRLAELRALAAWMLRARGM